MKKFKNKSMEKVNLALAGRELLYIILKMLNDLKFETDNMRFFNLLKIFKFILLNFLSIVSQALSKSSSKIEEIYLIRLEYVISSTLLIIKLFMACGDCSKISMLENELKKIFLFLSLPNVNPRIFDIYVGQLFDLLYKFAVFSPERFNKKEVDR
jgi:hypothetical protein